MKLIGKLSLAILALASVANADSVYLGMPAYGGNGCPQGTVGAVLSPDLKQLSILFDSYTAQAQGSVLLDRKSCNIAIPIHIPQGLSVSILEADYRGFNFLPSGANSVLSNQYFFAGATGPTLSKSFYGPLNANYLVTNKLAAATTVWSRCGADTNIRINSSIRVMTNRRGDLAESTVDSADVSAALVYLLQWKTCR